MIRPPMAGIHITDIEASINWWRERSPSPDGVSLPGPTRALAEVYALLVYFHETEADEATLPPWMSEAHFGEYVQAFSAGGFDAPLNWYREIAGGCNGRDNR